MDIKELKFKSNDFIDEDVESLPDVPAAMGISTQALKERFDNVGKTLIAMNHYNGLIDALTSTEQGNSGAQNIGLHADGIDAETVSSGMTELRSGLNTKANFDDLERKADKAELETKADKDNVLGKDNEQEFIPTQPYHPATKQYVDENGGTGGGSGTIKTLTGTKDGAALFSFNGTRDTTVAFDTPIYVANAGHASTADRSTNSDHATIADTAINAGYAENAENAHIADYAEFGYNSQVAVTALALQNSLTIKQNGTTLDVFDGSEAKTVDITSSSGGAAQTPVTYAQLTNLISTNALVAGNQYLLTDYVTKYQQPVTNVIKTSDEIERLVLTAVSSNALAVECSSLTYPNDIVYYDVKNNKCEDNTTARNGFILRRIDTKYNIDMPDDWRNMLWARFKATATVWTSGAITRNKMYQSGINLYIATKAGTPTSATDPAFFQLICTTNDHYWSSVQRTGLTLNMSDYAERYTFNANTDLTVKTPTKMTTVIPDNITVESGANISITGIRTLSNNVWYFDAYANRPYNVSAENGFYSNTFGSGCNSNTFGSSCYSNIFGSACNNNIFGSNCYKNIFGSTCYSNTSGSTCYNNTFGSSCCSNTFGSSCYSNIFGSTCQSNTFGSSLTSNTFGNNCYRNTFGSYCYNNTFGSAFQSNTFGSYCYSNTTTNNFLFNHVLPWFDSTDMTAIAELHGKTYNHQLFVNSTGNKRALHWVDNTPTYTTIT